MQEGFKKGFIQLGLIVGILLSILILAWLMPLHSHQESNLYQINSFVGFLYHWQTLVAGLLALLGAFITVYVIRQQIDNQKTQYHDAIKRREWAARARMPDALSEICRYTEDATAIINNTNINMPQLPEHGISELKSVIEHIEQNASRRVFKLLSHYQVQQSRLARFLEERSTGRINAIESRERLYDIAILRALTNSLYDYARDQVQTGPDNELSRADISEGLSNSVGLINITQNQSIYDLIYKMIYSRNE